MACTYHSVSGVVPLLLAKPTLRIPLRHQGQDARFSTRASQECAGAWERVATRLADLLPAP